METGAEFLGNSVIPALTNSTYREAGYDGSVAGPHLRPVVNPEDPEELDVSPDVENCPQQLPHPVLGAV